MVQAYRVADASTVRRWCRSLDNSPSPFCFLRQVLVNVNQWLAQNRVMDHLSMRLSWPTLAPFLQQLWPLRL